MAEFKHYVCWDRTAAFSVLNPEAERVDRDVFLAVHSDRPLMVATAAAGAGFGERQEEMAAEVFLTRFLDPREPHIQAVVVGDSGTGKSHLIKWLSLRVEETPQRIVLTIPKTGTSLRRILELIIDQLPEDEAARYREGLAGDSYETESHLARRKRLAYELSLALGNAQPSPGDPDEKWLLDNKLRLIFSDPHLESQLVREGGVIAHFVDHIGEIHTYTRSDTNRVFEIEDLPDLGPDTALAAMETQKALATLADPDLQPVAVRLINRVLPVAIARVLNFSPDRLIEVMTKVRQYLHMQGKELVLFIEDLARLQGIDGGLLQALVTEGGGDSGLCTLRWAAAVTAGYYDSNVPETVKTRLNFEIDMSQTAAAITADGGELIAFAARYLNAARAHSGELAEWAATDTPEQPPNRCDGCPFQRSCHDAFGEWEGVGLYPFTELALPRMLQLVDPDASEHFNPRKFIKGVLRSTLVDHLVEWDAGIFPSREYHRAIGGPDARKITGVRAQEIERMDSANADRQKALLDLWADSQLAIGEAIPEAFRLRSLTVGSPSPTPPIVIPASDGTPPPPPSLEARLIDELNDWGGDRDQLSEGTVNRLRAWVFDALDTAIDWDAEGISPGFFTRSDGRRYFKAANINFQRQKLAPTLGDIQLMIPLRDDIGDIRDASIALQALVKIRHVGSLSFSDAAEGYAMLSALLPTWASMVLGQIRERATTLGPVNRASEILLLRAALNGRTSESRAGWVNEAFADDAPRAVSPTGWQQLSDRASDANTSARELVRAMTSATKGGQIGALINPRPIIEALDRLDRAGWIVTKINNSSTSEVGRLHADLGARLPALVIEELTRQRAWYADVESELGEQDLSAFKEAVLGMRDELVRAGIGFDGDKEKEAVAALQLVNGQVLDRQRAILKGWAPPPADVSLPSLAVPERWEIVSTWGSAKPSIHRLLDEAEAAVSSSTDAVALRRAIDVAGARLGAALEELAEVIGDVGGLTS